MVGVLLLCALAGLVTPEPLPATNPKLRTDIEDAARDSRQLADDLAGMLARLEQEDVSIPEVKEEVLEENAEVESALQNMIKRVEDLAETAEGTRPRAGRVGTDRKEEEELHETLLELENVAKEIEIVAATSNKKSDTEAIEKMAKVLQDVSERLKGVEEASKKSKEVEKTPSKPEERKSSKAGKPKEDAVEKTIKKSKFANLFTNFFGRSGNLASKKERKEENSDDSETEDDIEEEENQSEEQDLEKEIKTSKLDDLLSNGSSRSGSAESKDTSAAADDDIDNLTDVVVNEDLADEEITTKSGVKDDNARKAKQLDDEFEDIEKVDRVKVPANAAPKVAAKEPEKEEAKEKCELCEVPANAAPKVAAKGPEKEEPKETCESKQQSNKIQVCTPGFKNKDSSLQFYTKKPVQSQYCFNTTRTVCEERSQAVSKEVCVYEYLQKEVIAPAHLAEVGFERKLYTLAVSRCDKKIVKEGYKDKEVEVCYLEDVDVPYRLPAVTARIEDFIELAAPVPEKRCRLVKYDVPEVVCKDQVDKECVTLQSLDPHTVNGPVSEVVQEYRAGCEDRVLEQETKVCTVEQRVKLPKYNQYNTYSG